MKLLPGTGEHDRDVIWLLIRANPVGNGSDNDFRDSDERQLAVLTYQIDQAFFAKFTEIVFRLRDAVAISDKQVAGVKAYAAFIIDTVIEQPNDGATAIQMGKRTVPMEDDGRKVSAIAVGKHLPPIILHRDGSLTHLDRGGG